MDEIQRRIDLIVTSPIQKGSIVLLRKEQIDPEVVPFIMNELRRAAGHDRFLLMGLIEGASLDVHGPEDLADAIRQLAQEAMNGSTEEASRTGTNHHE